MQGVELELKHVHAFGVYGWGSVCETIIGEWLEDISQNQVCETCSCSECLLRLPILLVILQMFYS